MLAIFLSSKSVSVGSEGAQGFFQIYLLSLKMHPIQLGAW